ncbi:hypothetical protein Ddye_005358 [Dipteronia dyeriana]|uniref:RRM domain-containing protein n=1 Tax=Dipteronia dyeriana TaxID=168575 RepID=A0AAE0CPJ7_9ROSI|nr:hypothetical protein Ddye_005358 [Dipteronia dyeriana]
MVRVVFLSSKKSSRRSSFAFVRFASMDEVTRVVGMTDGMFVNGWKISSKITKYGWSSRRSSGSNGFRSKIHDEIGNKKRQHQRRTFVGVVKGDQKKEIDSCEEVERVGDRSLADINWSPKRPVAEPVGILNEMKKLVWDRNQVDKCWISKCAVGSLRQFTNVSSMNRRLISRGFSFSTSYLGDMKVLWRFDSDQESTGFIKKPFLLG